MDSQIDTAQQRAENLYGSLTCSTFREQYHDPENDIAIIKDALQQARREALDEAAKVVCPYCNAPGQWELMSNSGYHQYGEAGHSLARCRATAIHEMLDRLREGV